MHLTAQCLNYAYNCTHARSGIYGTKDYITRPCNSGRDTCMAMGSASGTLDRDQDGARYPSSGEHRMVQKQQLRHCVSVQDHRSGVPVCARVRIFRVGVANVTCFLRRFQPPLVSSVVSAGLELPVLDLFMMA